jgi:two-component system response regulator YesN
LVVDDTPIIRSTIVNVVNRADMGFSPVLEAVNGADAIEKARQVPPDVVLMDIRMPGVDGLEAAGVIRREYPAARIVFLSAYDDFAYVQRALKLGAIDYILKPIRPSALRDLLGGLARGGVEEALPPASIATETPAATPAANGRNDPIGRALAYIGQNFRSSSISLAEVADAAHLSPSHLAHRFRQKVGVGYQQYVTNLRIDAAKTMLATSDLPVAVIAEDVGYPNLTNFYRLFQRETGLTPAAYRRANTSGEVEHKPSARRVGETRH